MSGPESGGPQATDEAQFASIISGQDVSDFGPSGQERVTDPALAHDMANAAAPHIDTAMDAEQARDAADMVALEAADNLAQAGGIRPDKQPQFDGSVRGVTNSAKEFGKNIAQLGAAEAADDEAAKETAQRLAVSNQENISDAAGRVLEAVAVEQRPEAQTPLNDMMQAAAVSGHNAEVARQARASADAAMDAVEKPASAPE